MRSSDESERIEILDWSQVHWKHIQNTVYGLVSFAIILYVLHWLFSDYQTILTPIVFFILQLTIGLGATRVFFKVGGRAQKSLRFLDPSLINSNWQVLTHTSTLAELSYVFEKIHNQLERKKPREIDDLNDISLFIIAVWAIVSTAVLTAFGPTVYIWGSSPIVLSFVSAIMYINGYQSTEPRHFEDDVGHLEYFIDRKLTEVCCVRTADSTHALVTWLVKADTRVLNEISVEICFRNSGPDVELEIRYYIGIPSKKRERFLITSRQPLTSTFINGLHSLSVVVDDLWEIRLEENGNGFSCVLSNPVPQITYDREEPLVPFTIEDEEAKKVLEMTVHEIVKIFGITE